MHIFLRSTGRTKYRWNFSFHNLKVSLYFENFVSYNPNVIFEVKSEYSKYVNHLEWFSLGFDKPRSADSIKNVFLLDIPEAIMKFAFSLNP